MLKLLGSITADRFGYVSPNNGPGPAERRITYSLIRKQNISWRIMRQLIFPAASFPLRPVCATSASPTGTGRMASIPETIDAGFPRQVSLTACLKTLSQNGTGFFIWS